MTKQISGWTHVEDAVGMAIEQVLAQDAAIEIVRGGSLRGQIGPMAALLRW